jgi:hypothetical protein
MTAFLDKIICKFGFHPESCGGWVAFGRICRRHYRGESDHE